MVCASKPWSISSACRNFRGQRLVSDEISSVEKFNLGGSTCRSITFLFSPNVGGDVVDQVFFRFSICGSVPEIFAIKLESCQKSRCILDVFCPPNFHGAGLSQKLCPFEHPYLAVRHVEKFRDVTPASAKVIGPHTLDFKPNFTYLPLNFLG